MNRALSGRVHALEGGQRYFRHEDWIDASSRLERGEDIDWSEYPPSHPDHCDELRRLK